MESASVQKKYLSNVHTLIKHTGMNSWLINPTCATPLCVACAPSGSLAFAMLEQAGGQKPQGGQKLYVHRNGF